jgi:lipopolysaccharide transport system permease protein
MLNNVRNLLSARELLMNWTRREFKVRYSQSFLGAAWAILQPLSFTIITTLVFSILLRVPSSDVPYPIFVYCGLLPWMFFANSLSGAIPSVADNFSLVSKVNFPREVLPLSIIIVGLIDFMFAASIFVVLMIIYQVHVGFAVLLIPLVLAIQFILILGISLFAGAFNVFYRDVRFIIPLVLQLLMYLSPIFYSKDVIPNAYKPFYFLNPMATIIDTYRRIIFFNQMPDWPYLGLAASLSLLILILAYRYFKKAERTFADII